MIDDKVKDFCRKEYASLTNNQQLPTSSATKEATQEQKSKHNMQNNGRWTREEHIRFVEGLSTYGKNWKQVEEHVQTRSGAQIRSHAQKFFNRLEREYSKKTQENTLNNGNQSNNSQLQQLNSVLPSNVPTQKYRKRLESFDSSFDPLSEDITLNDDDKINSETMKQLFPSQQNQKKSIKEWIQYYQEIEKNQMKLQQSDETRDKQCLDTLKKSRGIIQLLSAYENVEQTNSKENKKQDKYKASQFSGQKQNQTKISLKPEQKDSNSEKTLLNNPEIDIKHENKVPGSLDSYQISRDQTIEYHILQESEKQQQKTKKTSISSDQDLTSMPNANVIGSSENLQSHSNDTEETSQQPPRQRISHDQSFFSFLFNKYGNKLDNQQELPINFYQPTILPVQPAYNVKLSELVNLSNPANSTSTQMNRKRRKGSFNLVGDSEQENERLERLKKLQKTQDTYLDRIGKNSVDQKDIEEEKEKEEDNNENRNNQNDQQQPEEQTNINDNKTNINEENKEIQQQQQQE